MKYTIIIPTYKHLIDCLIPCVASIRKHTDFSLGQVEVLIVANGCGDDGTRVFVESLGDPFRLIWIEDQVGYTKAVNVGIKQAKGDYIIPLNNDCVLLEQQRGEWLAILNIPFLRDNTTGITGPMRAFCPEAQRWFLIFFCVMISRRVFEEVGYLDELFAPAYGEDTDLCCRAEDAGFKIVQVPEERNDYYADKRMVGDFPIFHDGNKSYKNWPGGEELLIKNNEILRRRYNKKTKVEALQNIQKQPEPPCATCVKIDRALQCDGYMSDVELRWLGGEAKKANIFIEIGSWHGRSSRAIADNLPEGAVLYCIDTWKGSVIEQDTNHASAKQNMGDHAFLEFCDNLFDLIRSGRVVPMRMESINAANFFKRKGITADVIFIDAGHTYQECKTDIDMWMPLVRNGGNLCGHDYCHPGGGDDPWPGVRQAVDEVFGHKGTDMGYIYGNSIWRHVIQWSVVSASHPNNFTGDGTLSFGLGVSGVKPNIYDCFPFFNELDILERRFEELYNTVDRFVIVEATLTHSGKPKPLYFHQNIDRYRKYLNKVTHIVVEDYPQVPENATVTDRSWAIERHQRDAIMRGLTECKDSDIIIISDADEIPFAEAIENYANHPNGIHSLDMDLFYYNETVKAADTWYEAKILPYSVLKAVGPCGARYTSAAPRIPKAGKHLSWQGGPDEIITKLEATAHQEYCTPDMKNRERIQQAIRNSADLFGRDYIKFEKVI